ncbi:hypothetical protein [Chelativorans sp. Marseille-P2723]|uniref:hypothetical protein n=1 Tax=Chelativorans sp. Marseille-P2723 TaxID=2709133 RepID=UPI00156EBE08|nr:hypothetical protein [Chelativorans sp. Marseille-P2723]
MAINNNSVNESLLVGLDNVASTNSNQNNDNSNQGNDYRDQSTNLGLGLTDSLNDNSNQDNDYSTNTDVGIGIEDSLNDNSDNSDNSNQDNDYSTNTEVEIGIEDSLNDSSTNNSNNDNSNRSQTDSNNDNSDRSQTNSHNDNSDNSTNASHNDASTTVDVALDVAIEDAFNDESIANSYNDNSTDDSTAFGNISLNFENIFDGAFGDGNGNTAFAVSQVADIVDQDTLSGFAQHNNGTFNAQAYADDASIGGSWDYIGSDNGNGDNGVTDVTTIADARASASGTAFNMEVVMGANLQQNAFSANVVGGDMVSETNSGDSF